MKKNMSWHICHEKDWSETKTQCRDTDQCWARSCRRVANRPSTSPPTAAGCRGPPTRSPPPSQTRASGAAPPLHSARRLHQVASTQNARKLSLDLLSKIMSSGFLSRTHRLLDGEWGARPPQQVPTAAELLVVPEPAVLPVAVLLLLPPAPNIHLTPAGAAQEHRITKKRICWITRKTKNAFLENNF